jgi:diguanylate cyclase (GGDEF)-like protein/PAS domain S-box-containing protein
LGREDNVSTKASLLAPNTGFNPTTLADRQLAEAERLADLGHWTWSPSTGFSCSAGLLAVLGRQRGPKVRDVLRRLGGRQSLFLAIRDAQRGGLPAAFELSIPLPDGKRHMATGIVRAEGDQLWGLVQDVTALHHIASELDRSESRWEMALESARQGVWDSDISTGVVYHSRTWRSMRGMNPEGDAEDPHDVWADRVHPEDLPRIMDLIRRQHTGELQRVHMEYRERHRDGHYMWISSLGSPIEWFPNGTPKRIIGTDTDITERKTNEDQMVRLSRRLELALEVSRIGLFEANLDTGELFWDGQVREIYGIDDDKPIGPTFWEEQLHPDDSAMARHRVEKAVESRSSYISEFRIIRRSDNQVRIVRTQGRWYRDSLGTPRMLGVNWDVTEEVAAHRELQRAKDLAEARNRELEAAKARIEHNALHDTLTGLPNRRYLDQVLADRAAEAALTGASVALLHIDLDRFKQINDTLGHIAGDAMLVHAAELLRRNMGAGDFVARVGGDEFIVVCSYAGEQNRLIDLARAVVEQMRQPVPYHGHFCRFGASIGIAAQHGNAVDPVRLMIDADIALYRAKARGKNGYEFFSEALQAEAVHTKRLADEILQGIEQDEFLPYYQPLFDARTMELSGVEALARWRHPVEGILPPARFLRVAEDLNVVTSIDSTILRKALDDFDQWRKAGLHVPAVSVNVSFRRLRDERLVASLRDMKFEAGTLSFELLESIFLDDIDDMVSWNLDRIRDLGIDLSIDDFGTGHASILSLLRLRPTRFKIDRQFLDQLTTSRSQQQLVGSLIDIGRSLNIKVVAEGVETFEQAEILRGLGCDILQGFAFARPMPAKALESMLRGPRWHRAS